MKMPIPESARFGPGTTPEWLAKAEEAERERETLEEQQQRARAADQAKKVNTHLAQVGITPAWPASAGRWVAPALLVYGSARDETYPVWASYRDDLGVVLLVGGDDEGRRAEFAGELNTVADVVRAHREGSVPGDVGRPDWRRQAEQTAGRELGFLSSDAAALYDGLRGLTAAVLGLQRGPSVEVATGAEVDLDCEFLPDDLTPHGLVSLGLTAGPGRSLYVVNADMDVAAVRRVQFQREHVWPHLPLTADGALDRSHPHVLGYAEIRRRVEAFFAELGEDVTLWVNCGAQDVIRLHTLWRNDWSVMPDTIPEWADDLERLRRLAGGVKLPPHTGRHHHALDDAEHQRQARAFLRSLVN